MVSIINHTACTVLSYLCVDVGVLPVADHLGALLHVALQVLLVRVQERRHGRLQDPRKHLDLRAKTTTK